VLEYLTLGYYIQDFLNILNVILKVSNIIGPGAYHDLG
jgi:hypothetical protein